MVELPPRRLPCELKGQNPEKIKAYQRSLERKVSGDDKAYDVHEVRSKFPILNETSNGHKLVYLDNAATTQKPNEVIEAIVNYYRETNSNVHRGNYSLSQKSSEQYEAAREAIASFIKSPEPNQVVFTRNTTEAINLVSLSWGMNNINKGDTIGLTVMEHHSNLVPWQEVAKKKNAQLEFIQMDKDGRLDRDSLEEVLQKNPKLLAVTAASNVTGTLNPLKEIISRAHEKGSLVIVDAAQLVPHKLIDVRDLDADWLAFSGHKMYGPTGIGILYGKKELLNEMEPVYTGGSMIKSVSFHNATWGETPWKFESGTPPIAEAIALKAAVDFLSETGMNSIGKHEEKITKYALEKLGELEEVILYGPKNTDERTAVVSFNIKNMDPHDVSHLMDKDHGIATRAGYHCAQPLMKKLKAPVGTTRASFGMYNTPCEVDALIRGVKGAIQESKAN